MIDFTLPGKRITSWIGWQVYRQIGGATPIKDAAERYDVSEASIHDWIKRGFIPTREAALKGEAISAEDGFRIPAAALMGFTVVGLEPPDAPQDQPRKRRSFSAGPALPSGAPAEATGGTNASVRALHNGTAKRKPRKPSTRCCPAIPIITRRVA